MTTTGGTKSPSTPTTNIEIDSTDKNFFASPSSFTHKRTCLCQVKNHVEVLSKSLLSQQQQQQKLLQDDESSVVKVVPEQFWDNTVAGPISHESSGTSSNSSSCSSPLLCSSCCTRALHPYAQRNEDAKRRWKQSRDYCGQRLKQLHQRNLAGGESSSSSTNNHHYNLSELQYKSTKLRQRLDLLKQKCSELAIEVTTKSLENDERKAKLQQYQQQFSTSSSEGTTITSPAESSSFSTTQSQPPGVYRNHLIRLEQSIIHGSMKNSIQSAKEQLQIMRYQWALQVFKMYRLDVSNTDTIDYKNGKRQQSSNRGGRQGVQSSSSKLRQKQNQHQKQKQAQGIGKIGGLPLPHAGPELYGFLPALELQSALRLVASITSTVARCLGIILPHPILLQPHLSSNDIIDDIETAVAAACASSGGAANNDNDDMVVIEDTRESNNTNDLTNTKHGGNSDDNNQLTQSLLSLVQDFSFSSAAATQTNKYQLLEKKGRWGLPKGVPGVGNLLRKQKTNQGNSVSSLNKGKQPKSKRSIKIVSGAQHLLEETAKNTVIPPSMDPSFVALRLRHATAAILAEDHNNIVGGSTPATSAGGGGGAHQFSTASQYALSADVINDDEFAIALQLLQNNIIALCIRACVPVSQLWPAEAILLNLRELQYHCEEQITAIATNNSLMKTTAATAATTTRAP